jgi:nucleotide-binding universal stress UspA family protein
VVEPWSPPWGRTYFDEPSLAEFACAHADLDARLLLGEQTDADLVVVGHAGAGYLRSTWMGSTAEWLLHHPTAPLAIVRSAAQVQQVTYCSDGSEHARRALEAFLALPLAATCDVTVLAVDDERADVETAVAATARLEAAGVGHTQVRAHGHPSRVILEHLEANRPQLVVLGTRGLTGWHRLRLGSTAAAVVHHAPCTSLVACVDEDSTRA